MNLHAYRMRPAGPSSHTKREILVCAILLLAESAAGVRSSRLASMQALDMEGRKRLDGRGFRQWLALHAVGCCRSSDMASLHRARCRSVAFRTTRHPSSSAAHRARKALRTALLQSTCAARSLLQVILVLQLHLTLACGEGLSIIKDVVVLCEGGGLE